MEGSDSAGAGEDPAIGSHRVSTRTSFARVRADGRHGPVRMRQASISRALRRLVFALCALGGMLLLSGGPALAAEEAHHVFGGSLKAEGSTCEKFLSEPTGVAVNESNHDVYVYDRATNSIDWITSQDECMAHRKAGSETSGEEGKEGIAVDNSNGPSAGDVYVVANNTEHDAIRKYKPELVEGKHVLTLVHTIPRFKKKEVGAEEFSFEEEIHGIAVDSTGALWVYAGERTILGFSGDEANESLSITEAGGECAAREGFGVSAKADFFYVAKERENHLFGCDESASLMKLNEAAEPAVANPGEEPAYKAQLDNENITGIAVDDTNGTVYADNGTSISAFDAEALFIQRFANEAGPGQLHEGRGIAVDSSTNDVYAADALEAKINVYVPTGQEPPGKPEPELPDHRKWEMVSPPNKFGASIFGISRIGGIIQASNDGSAITYTASAPIVPTPPTNRAPEPAQVLSRRGSQSWTTESINAPHPEVPAGFKSGAGPEYEFFSENLSAGLLNPAFHGLEPPKPPPLSPEASEGTPFWRNLTAPSSSCEPTPSSCYQALVSPLNDTTGKPFGGQEPPLRFTSATPDGSYAVLASKVALTSEASEEEGLYEWEREHGGALHLVSILPTGEGGTTTEVKLGGPGEQAGSIMRHAISEDGSRIIWSKEENHGTGEAPLYMRDMSKGQTLRVDKAQGVAEPEEPGAVYQTADEKGTKIFFTDAKRITPDSTIEPEEEESPALGDLYVCEVGEEAGGKLTCKLTDLTAGVARSSEGVASESAAVQGVLGASEDGTYVYFVANGVLAPGASPGRCEARLESDLVLEAEGKLPPLSCNLYVRHFNGTGWDPTKFIAALSTEEIRDWLPITTGGGGLATMTSRVSPNGLHLAFMSNRSLTGYNNVDANPTVKARDEEVFLYNVSSERSIVCVSCNVSGAQPKGVFDEENAGEGKGLVMDRQLNWNQRWLAADLPGWTARSREAALVQSRYLSDNGRLFFNSTDNLVPADTNGKADVYEYEPNGEGTCASPTGCVSLISSGQSTHESAFEEASVSGNDVFFLTSESLAPQDVDTGLDIYDAHVCSASSECQSEQKQNRSTCETEPSEATCRSGQTSVPAPPPAPTSSLPAAGNSGTLSVLGETKKKPLPETRQQKLKKALKACKRLKKKKKRVACEKREKKKYGAATKKKSKTKKSSRTGKR